MSRKRLIEGVTLFNRRLCRHIFHPPFINPNTTSRYLRSLGIEQVREALEKGLKKPAKVIEFRKKVVKTVNLKTESQA
jgi:hypothetical protein